ncbi:uncharacterized protein LOC132947190 [Metopolophium dirhodum]|uniref:uncharacterized protein LOC132947190 n=1 Tax=Metopolophium dirhodum TaxID=44670 RepID=UPI0029900E70|nr:uncharacterized protein LOC132947190 [Metopolophium dirhodum]
MDSSDDQGIEGVAELPLVSPIRKNQRGKIVGSRERLLIVNMYKANIQKDPNMSLRQMRTIISKEMGIGESTVHRTIKEYNTSNTVKSPKRTKVRAQMTDTFDDFARNAVRRHVHSIWFRREIPTLDKIYKVVSDDNHLPTVSRSTIFKLLKELKFHYVKKGRNSALTEKTELILWRRRYLRSIRSFREEGRHIYYLDETWVDAGDCPNYEWRDTTITSHRDAFLKGMSTGSVNPSGKGKRLIVLHIGSEDGFVDNGLLCFEFKKNTRDYHDEMNGQTFCEWMENILPRLKDNCVIVMDNASYHSVKLDKAPTSSTKKADIIQWLEDKGEVVDRTMIVRELLDVVKKIKPLNDKYVIDEIAKAQNKTILRLPPYHCELNPIELAWSSVKHHVRMNNTTFKLPDVKNLLIEGIQRVDADMWKNIIKHTTTEENKFWEIDNIIDEVFEAETQNVTLTVGNTSSESESDSD